MLEDDNEFLPPREEDVPEHLAQKWEERENRKGFIICAKCHKRILASSSFCAYCGQPLDTPNHLWRIGVATALLIVFVILGNWIFKHL